MKKIDEEIGNKIILLRQKGMSLRSIEKEVEVERHKISRFLKDSNINTQNLDRHKYYEDIFKVIDTQEKAYWLGILYADGCVRNEKNMVTLTLNIEDEYILEKFANFVSEDLKPTKHSINAKRVSISNSKIYNDLLNKGLMERKSLKLKFPNIKILPIYLQSHFIRGYFDGDGGLFIETNKNGKTKSLLFHITGTFEFLEEVQKILGTNNKLNIESKNGNVATLRIKGNQKTLRIMNFLYKDAAVFMKRKYNIYQQFIEMKSTHMPSDGESHQDD